MLVQCLLCGMDSLIMWPWDSSQSFSLFPLPLTSSWMTEWTRALGSWSGLSTTSWETGTTECPLAPSMSSRLCLCRRYKYGYMWKMSVSPGLWGYKGRLYLRNYCTYQSKSLRKNCYLFVWMNNAVLFIVARCLAFPKFIQDSTLLTRPGGWLLIIWMISKITNRNVKMFGCTLCCA